MPAFFIAEIENLDHDKYHEYKEETCSGKLEEKKNN